MDLDFRSNSSNPGKLNFGAVPKRPKLKPFPSYAASNKLGSLTKKKRQTKGSKKRTLKYKQNLG